MFSGQWVGTSSFGSFKGECLINIEPKNECVRMLRLFFFRLRVLSIVMCVF